MTEPEHDPAPIALVPKSGPMRPVIAFVSKWRVVDGDLIPIRAETVEYYDNETENEKETK